MDIYAISDYELRLNAAGTELEVWDCTVSPAIKEETYNLNVETIRVKILDGEFQVGQELCSGCFLVEWDLPGGETLTFDGVTETLTGVTDLRIEARIKPAGTYTYDLSECEVHLFYENSLLKIASPCDPPCEEAMSGCLNIVLD